VKDYVGVICPKCGALIDIPIVVESITFRDGDFNKPKVILVEFEMGHISDHECRR